ncbi:hypothetical protein N658DRAFT_276068 [Parathielavia hyrcaniae]|uniref:Uncharacterized protein n=1 Tax=Parathielavia hyrcaniae TaxID=113614 RepID=A0AAN6T3J2_9PEZI|nr:hypothetical protein N658DRAFT_276068 [Parathielavia hyrcaniae]
MFGAVDDIADLLPVVKREDEVNRKILALSVSQSMTTTLYRFTRYGHYPVLTGKDIKYVLPAPDPSFFRHSARRKRQMDGISIHEERLRPEQFKNICFAIDDLPSDLDSDV